MTKTCGQCKYFDVDRGPGGGKLRHPDAPGSCAYVVRWPVLPQSFYEFSFERRGLVLRLPTASKMRISSNADRCATFEAKDVRMERQLEIE